MIIEQYPVAVRNFSSEYGPPYSNLQVLKNVCGKPEETVQYGDNQFSAVFRKYGQWHSFYPSFLAYPKYQSLNYFPVSDFMECSFLQPVYASSICIQENFFPGFVSKIFGTKHYDSNSDSLLYRSNNKWQMLWDRSTILEMDYFSLYKYNVCIINISKTVSPIDILRIEFDFSLSEYHNQYEVVKLTGEPAYDLFEDDEKHDYLLGTTGFSLSNDHKKYDAIDHSLLHDVGFQGIVALPNEILIRILDYLDIDDLCRARRINKLFNQLAKDPSLYTSINLQPFCKVLYDDSILNISKNCSALQILDLSWIGPNNQISTSAICSFLRNIPNVVVLRLSSCQMLASSVLETIAIYCSNLQLLDISYCNNSLQLCVSWLTTLKMLKYIDFTHTLISTSELVVLLKKLNDLEWLFLGSPALIADQDCVINCLCNKPSGNLKGIDLWYWDKISYCTITQFLLIHGQSIVEINLGWCLGIGITDILPFIASYCPNIKVLILTAHHETTDAGLISLSSSCPYLEQLDILGSRHITYIALEAVVNSCLHLTLLDVSYCNKISIDDVAHLKAIAPKISIKHVETYVQRAKT